MPCSQSGREHGYVAGLLPLSFSEPRRGVARTQTNPSIVKQLIECAIPAPAMTDTIAVSAVLTFTFLGPAPKKPERTPLAPPVAGSGAPVTRRTTAATRRCASAGASQSLLLCMKPSTVDSSRAGSSPCCSGEVCEGVKTAVQQSLTFRTSFVLQFRST